MKKMKTWVQNYFLWCLVSSSNPCACVYFFVWNEDIILVKTTLMVYPHPILSLLHFWPCQCCVRYVPHPILQLPIPIIPPTIFSRYGTYKGRKIGRINRLFYFNNLVFLYFIYIFQLGLFNPTINIFIYFVTLL